MTYVIIAVAYLLGAYITAAAGFADWQAFDEQLQKDCPIAGEEVSLAIANRSCDLNLAISYAIFPPLWISVLIATKGYRYGFDWTFKGK